MMITRFVLIVLLLGAFGCSATARAAHKPRRPICPITITLQLHCTLEGVALIA
jgi:hypothetical protein